MKVIRTKAGQVIGAAAPTVQEELEEGVHGHLLTMPNIQTCAPAPHADSIAHAGSVVFFRISTSPPVLRPFLITSTHPGLAISGIVFFSGDADRGYEWCKRFAFFPPSKHNPMLALERVAHGDGLGQWTSMIPDGEGK